VQVTRATFIPLLAPGNSPSLDPSVVREEYCADLTLVYSLGPSFGRRVVTHADLDQMDLSPRVLRRTAFEHLEALAGDRAQFHGQPPSLMLSFDGLESSLLLATEFWNRLQGVLPGELVVGVPARDVAIVTGSQSPQGLEKVRRCVDRVFFAGDENLLTRTLLVRRGGTWEPFDRAARPVARPTAHSHPAERPPRQYQEHPSWPGERVPVTSARPQGEPPAPIGRPTPAAPPLAPAAGLTSTGSLPLGPTPSATSGPSTVPAAAPPLGVPKVMPRPAATSLPMPASPLTTGGLPPITTTGSLPVTPGPRTGSLPPVTPGPRTGSLPPVTPGPRTGSLPPVTPGPRTGSLPPVAPGVTASGLPQRSRIQPPPMPAPPIPPSTPPVRPPTMPAPPMPPSARPTPMSSPAPTASPRPSWAGPPEPSPRPAPGGSPRPGPGGHRTAGPSLPPLPSSAVPYSAMPYSATPSSAMPYSAVPSSAMPYSAMPYSAMPYSGGPGSSYPQPAFSRGARSRQHQQKPPYRDEPYPTSGGSYAGQRPVSPAPYPTSPSYPPGAGAHRAPDQAPHGTNPPYQGPSYRREYEREAPGYPSWGSAEASANDTFSGLFAGGEAPSRRPGWDGRSGPRARFSR